MLSGRRDYLVILLIEATLSSHFHRGVDLLLHEDMVVSLLIVVVVKAAPQAGSSVMVIHLSHDLLVVIKVVYEFIFYFSLDDCEQSHIEVFDIVFTGRQKVLVVNVRHRKVDW